MLRLRIRIRDSVPFRPLDPGFGMGNNQDPDPGWKKNRIQYKHPGYTTLRKRDSGFYYLLWFADPPMASLSELSQ